MTALSKPDVERLADAAEDHAWTGGYFCKCGHELNSPAGHARHLTEALAPTIATLRAEWEAEARREVVAAVRAALPDSESVRDEHLAQEDRGEDCGCAYKDCYECGKWHNCIHGTTGVTRAVSDALAPFAGDGQESTQDGAGGGQGASEGAPKPFTFARNHSGSYGLVERRRRERPEWSNEEGDQS